MKGQPRHRWERDGYGNGVCRKCGAKYRTIRSLSARSDLVEYSIDHGKTWVGERELVRERGGTPPCKGPRS